MSVNLSLRVSDLTGVAVTGYLISEIASFS
jgi:hypothetical protein